MAQQAAIDQQLEQTPHPPREDMISCVGALEAALLPCLPARELQAIDRSPHQSHQSNFPFFSKPTVYSWTTSIHCSFRLINPLYASL